jgi:hypothetical protein
LGGRRERPRHGRAAQQRDELAPASFDHLVGAQQERLWDFEVEGLCGGQIDDEIEFGWLLDWDVARLRPAQNLVSNVAGAAE